jgi:predicted dinucleotide-binding enzyme
MKIGILGSGVVGFTIANAVLAKGHDVMIGSRTSNHEKTTAWSREQGAHALHGTFKETALWSELLFLCVNGSVVKSVIELTEAGSCKDKILIDLTNPLDFSKGMPPSLLPEYSNHYSLGEFVQEQLPETKVVKALNTVNCKLMVDANLVNNGVHHLFLCGNDPEAKNTVKHFLADNFNWKPECLLDFGNIQAARLTEAIVPFWVGAMKVVDTPLFNYLIVK